MTPWFELVRHTRQAHAEALARGRDRRLARPVHRRAENRDLVRRGYTVVWWWCRPRDGTVYVLRDRRRRLGVVRG